MAGEGVALWRKVGTASERAWQCRELVHLAWGCRAGCTPGGGRQRGRAPGGVGRPGQGSASETGKVFSARTGTLGARRGCAEDAGDALARGRDSQAQSWRRGRGGDPPGLGVALPELTVRPTGGRENELQRGTGAVTAV